MSPERCWDSKLEKLILLTKKSFHSDLLADDRHLCASVCVRVCVCECVYVHSLWHVCVNVCVYFQPVSKYFQCLSVVVCMH